MTCPNCSQVFDGDRCPNCGRPARSRAGRVTAILLLVFLTLPSAAVGACSAFIALPPNRDSEGFWQLGLLIGGVALTVFLGSLILVRKTWRS